VKRRAADLLGLLESGQIDYYDGHRMSKKRLGYCKSTFRTI